MSVTDMHYRTVPEVANELRVSRRTVYRAVASGELRAVRLGERGSLRIREDALKRFVRPAQESAGPFSGLPADNFFAAARRPELQGRQP